MTHQMQLHQINQQQFAADAQMPACVEVCRRYAESGREMAMAAV